MDDMISVQKELAELRAQVEENNRILKAMRRNALVMGTVKMLVWVVLLFGSYYLTMQFLEPYLGALGNMQEGAQGGGLQDLFEQYRELMGQ